ncbi:MAG: VanZ family protein [Kiritimatiellales bacterium]|nr:VanZ family protein [Kiritimatiellales bacterium]
MKTPLLRLPAIFLLGTTILFWSLYDRYEPAGPILLSSPALASASAVRGAVSEDGGRFILDVPPAGKPAELRFALPAATDHPALRIRARIKVDGVAVGKYPWSCARLLLVQYDARNKWIPGHHGMVAEQGSKDWKQHEDVFEIFPETARTDVVLQQGGTAGRAEYDALEVQPVRIRGSFPRWRIVFAVLWLCMAIFYFPVCRLHRRRLKVLVLLNAVAILAGTLMPGIWVEDAAVQMKAAAVRITASPPVPPAAKPAVKAPAAPPKPGDRETTQMDRFNELIGNAHLTGHFVLFATLCFLVYLSAALERQHPAYFFKVGFDILLFAAITESLQFLTIDRKAGICDLRVDVYGMALAFLVFLAVLGVWKLVRRFSGSTAG